MAFDAARWQITLAAQDTTAAAFNSLNQRMKQMEIVAGGVSQGMSTAFAGITRMLGPLSAAMLAAAAAHKVWAAGMAAADLGEQAEQVGLTTDQLQAYRLVAAQSGVTVEQLDTMMMRLTKSMGAANEGNDEMIARFDKLGVKLLDAEGKMRKPAEVLPELARGLLAMGDGAERNALMMEIFGRSGSRGVTILEALAQGNQKVIDTAREQGAIIEGETIKKWDALSDAMKTAEIRSGVLWAQLGKPIATHGLQVFNSTLKETAALMAAIDKTKNWLFGGGATGGDLAGMQKEAAEIQKRIDENSGKKGTAAQAALQRDYARLGMLQQKIADEMTAAYEPPVIREPEKPGISNPTSNKSKAAGDSAQKKLDALIVERQALENALSKFEVQGNETVAEMEKRLDRAVALQKKVASLTEGLPKDSPLAQQMTAEATAINDLNQKLEDKRKLMQSAEQTVAKYGDGSKAAARAIEDLNAQLAAGLITQQEHAAALRATTQAQQEQAIAARGSVEGFDAFTAGMEHIISQSSKMSRSFQYGEKAVQLMDDAISQLVQNGEINFNRLLSSFITMIAQMEMKAAMSSLWSAFGGSAGGGIGGSLIGGLVSGIGSMFGPSLSTLQGGIGPGGQVLLFADGGRPPPNRASIVGERGPELFVPDSAGTIIPNDQLGGGGGDAVSITMNNSFGGGVTHAEMLRYGAMIEERAKAGAMAGIEAKRKRGGSIKQVFRG